MSGPVDWATLIWIVGLVIVAAGAAVALVWRVFVLIGEERDLAKRERHDLRNELMTLITGIDTDFHAFQLRAAETYATKAGVSAGMDRVVDELKGLRVDTKEGIAGLRTETRDGLDKLGDRIERMENHVLEGRSS